MNKRDAKKQLLKSTLLYLGKKFSEIRQNQKLLQKELLQHCLEDRQSPCVLLRQVRTDAGDFFVEDEVVLWDEHGRVVGALLDGVVTTIESQNQRSQELQERF